MHSFSMRIHTLCVLIVLEFLAYCYAISYDDFAFPIDHFPLHNDTRYEEIKKHCNSFISSASTIEFDEDNMDSSLKYKLSFFNGDWEQDSHGATLMPFDDSDMPYVKSSFISPWKVVSFQVKNVTSNSTHQPKNTVRVSGVLSIGITRNSTRIAETDLKFLKRPGMSALKVDFEGLYLETEENGGERLLCFLGNSTFPFKKVPRRYADDYDMESYFSIRDSTYDEELVILPYDQILLVLRYPKTPSLSTSPIYGEMISLNKKEHFEYFDKVHITSQSSIIRKHDISSEELNLDYFDQNSLKDAILEDGVNKFNNSEVCRILKYFEHEEYRVMPNLKLGGQNGFQDTVGPFLLRNEIQLVDRNNENLRIIMHKIICEKDTVSGVLRMYPATIDPHVAARRTGLSTLTLSVKGKWNPSTGLLSMTGCLGPTLVKCESGVIFYFPKSFSSKQRSVVSGSIFSLKNATNMFLPVFIGLEMLSPGLHDNGWYSGEYLSYNYSKHDFAIKFKERIEEPRLITYIRKSLFRYPTLEVEKDGISSITNRLLDNLRINTFSSLETFVSVEVLSLGPSFRTIDSHFHQVSNSEVLNVSLNLLLIENPNKVKEKSYRHISKLYLEGVYDQRVGKLYMIGCRKVDFDQVDLERGLDCLIEVTIEYSPVNTRWLINPTAMISIGSQRNEEHDNYYFDTIRLHTFMIHDKNHENNVAFRKIFEGYFRVFLLLVYIFHISNHIRKMNTSRESVPYISLVMVGMWIIGYGITVFYSKEIMVKSYESQQYKNQPYDLRIYKQYLNNLDYFARFLVLVLMVLIARIFQIVLKARKALGESSPSDKKVLVISLVVYVCYLFVLISLSLLELYITEVVLTKDVCLKLVKQVMWYTVEDLQEYYLILQLIAFRIWKPRLSDPLLYSFFMILYVPFIFKLFYNLVRDPVSYPI